MGFLMYLTNAHSIKFLCAISLLLLLASCATSQFKSTIENNSEDLLAEESFMRYNSIRLDQNEKKNISFIIEATRACHAEKFKKGLEILEENTEANKKNPEFWNAMGTCYLLKKEFNKGSFFYNLGLEALQNETRPIQKRLVEAMIKNNLALLTLKNGRTNEAYDLFKEASTIAPEFHTPVFNMAQIYMEFQQNEKALELLEGLRQKNSKDVDVLYSLAVLYQRINQAKKSYLAINGINPQYLNRADIVGVYALNLFQNKEYEKAKTILEKRTYAEEFNSRNKMLLELVDEAIKAEKAAKN